MASTDNNGNFESAVLVPTPSDTVPVVANKCARGILIAGAGAVALKMSDGANVTITGLSVGTIHSLKFTHVLATGTAATGIIAFY